MSSRIQLFRAKFFLVILTLCFVAVAAQLVNLQVVQHAKLSQQVQQNTQREFIQSPRRGDILDANSNLLATCVPVKTVSANPSLLGNLQPVVARAIAPYLQMDEASLIKKLTPTITRNAKGEWVTNGLRYVRLAKNVPEETWQKIYGAMTNLNFGVVETNLSKERRAFLRDLRARALTADADQMRVYPLGSLAGQVVGFPRMEETNIQGRVVSQIIGCDGVEFALQKQLSGVAGWRATARDKKNRELVLLRDQDVPVRDGLDVVLTLDTVVQHILEEALAEAMAKHSPKSVTGVVMRPKTGEILAMASLPNYDPNRPNTISTNTRNRVINDVVEPGSTFKIVVVSGALNENVVGLNENFFCENGRFAYAGKVLHDHEGYGNLTTEGIITKSSNIGAAKIGIRLGEDKLFQYAWDYGFGQRTGIPLPGEARGLLYPPTDRDHWTKVSIAQIPMGHGVAVTRLQMVQAMAAIANNGWLMRPMLVKQLQRHNGMVVQAYQPERVRQVVSQATSKKMVQALKTVVLKGGTSPEAALENYEVAGKTGTAQKAEHGIYAPGKYISSFIGFFPADEPELCISIVLDEPKEGHYGGKVCGPVFKSVAQQCASYLNIPPDPKMVSNAPPLTVRNP
jgi:cell division protein FtsI/penicillin-binding protein 2